MTETEDWPSEESMGYDEDALDPGDLTRAEENAVMHGAAIAAWRAADACGDIAARDAAFRGPAAGAGDAAEADQASR